MELTIQQRDKDNQGNRVEVLQEIVRCSVQGHLAGLRDEIIPDLSPADEVEWKEEK